VADPGGGRRGNLVGKRRFVFPALPAPEIYGIATANDNPPFTMRAFPGPVSANSVAPQVPGYF